MTDTIIVGPTIGAELEAAGVAHIAIASDGTPIYPADVRSTAEDGSIVVIPAVTDDVKARVAAVLAAHDPSKPGPAIPHTVSKAEIVSRMTDPELDRFDAALTSATTRQRRMWTDCHEIRSDNPYFAALKQQFAAAFGAGRAAALLAAN